jgi:hypothetical protein
MHADLCGKRREAVTAGNASLREKFAGICESDRSRSRHRLSLKGRLMLVLTANAAGSLLS